jgi:hypothetical protein
VHIDDILVLGDAQVALGILTSCVVHQPFYSTRTIPPYSFLFLLVGFNKRVMQVYGDITGPRSWESFQGPLVRLQTQLPISFDGIDLFFYGGLCPIYFLKELDSSGFVFVL